MQTALSELHLLERPRAFPEVIIRFLKYRAGGLKSKLQVQMWNEKSILSLQLSKALWNFMLFMTEK